MTEMAARGTHRILAQWVTIMATLDDGVIVRFEDGSNSTKPIPFSDLIRVTPGFTSSRGDY